MMLTARTLIHDGASLGYFLGATFGALTLSMDPRERDPLAWRTAPTVQGGGPAGIGYVSTLSNAARRAGDIGITGASARTVEIVFRAPGGAGTLYAFGATGTNASDALEITSGGDARWAHGSNDVLLPGAGGGQGWRHLVLRADAQGRCRATLDGAALLDTTFPLGALATARGELRILESVTGAVAAGADLALLALWTRELTEVEIANHRAALFNPHRLEGTAVLASGDAATQVRVRRATDLQHLLAVTPDAGGNWSAQVPPGEYEIVIVGPGGFEPQVYPVVSAVPA